MPRKKPAKAPEPAEALVNEPGPQPTTGTAVTVKCPALLEGPCCQHSASPLFGLGPVVNGKPTILGRQRLCCHCGQLSVMFGGVIEPGHGPYVAYQELPKIALATALPGQ